MYVCVCTWVCLMSSAAHRGPEGALKLDLKVTVSFVMWVLGTKFGSSLPEQYTLLITEPSLKLLRH